MNIYPQEWRTLVAHPRVLDAAVFGVPDDEMGQRVMAAVQTVDSADANDQFAGEPLAWHMRPLVTLPGVQGRSRSKLQLPRTDTGKLYKSGLGRKNTGVTDAAGARPAVQFQTPAISRPDHRQSCPAITLRWISLVPSLPFHVVPVE